MFKNEEEGMVKRIAQVSLAVFMVLALATAASAVDVASTSLKGSMLIFPKVISYEGDVETYFFIGNDNTVETYVKCYWMDDNQEVEDFHFLITANQPIVFATDENAYGPKFGLNTQGSLVCWAQNAADSLPEVFNHLYGYAMIAGDANVFYNAYSLPITNLKNNYMTRINETQIQLNLYGTNAYAACPKYLITNFAPGDDDTTGVNDLVGGAPDLTLWPCKQDLRQDRIPTCTKAKFDIWNWNEVKFTGAYQCFKCFFEGYLHVIGNATDTTYGGQYVSRRGPGFGGEKFLKSTLGDYGYLFDDAARLRITGVKSDPVCVGAAKAYTGVPSKGVKCTTTENVGLLGVMLYGAPVSTTFPASINPVAGYTLHGAGQFGTPATGGSWIKIDVDEDLPEIPEAPAR